MIGSEGKVIDKFEYNTKENNIEAKGKFIGHSNSIRNVNMSPDNKYMLSSCEDHSLRLWDYENF